jgi:lactate racemase
MIYSQSFSPTGSLDQSSLIETLTKGLSGKFTNQRVLVLIPDHTRSLPLTELFPIIVDLLNDARQLDFMVALGTHPPLSNESINELVGITSEERSTTYRQIGFYNHVWDDPTMLVSLGVMDKDEIRELAGKSWHSSLPEMVDIRINKLALAYDHILILGPTFPHEVVGFSGGAKYLFPGISGPDVINATHWLGALAGVVGTIGIIETPVRSMIHAAANRLPTPVTLAALVMAEHDVAGIFIGDMYEAWNLAADFSAKRNIIWCRQPYRRVLSCAPAMYDELWTAGKAMYKIEPAVAVGGEVIIYAPHLEVISHVHGRYIYEVGYHTLPYFLNDWEHYKHIPLGVLAHSTHVRGSGVMDNGVEKPNVHVILSSKVSAEDCARLNLGYIDPAKINITEWQNQEDNGVLYVPRAGEILYRAKAG